MLFPGYLDCWMWHKAADQLPKDPDKDRHVPVIPSSRPCLSLRKSISTLFFLDFPTSALLTQHRHQKPGESRRNNRKETSTRWISGRQQTLARRCRRYYSCVFHSAAYFSLIKEPLLEPVVWGSSCLPATTTSNLPASLQTPAEGRREGLHLPLLKPYRRPCFLARLSPSSFTISSRASDLEIRKRKASNSQVDRNDKKIMTVSSLIHAYHSPLGCGITGMLAYITYPAAATTSAASATFLVLHVSN